MDNTVTLPLAEFLQMYDKCKAFDQAKEVVCSEVESWRLRDDLKLVMGIKDEEAKAEETK